MIHKFVKRSILKRRKKERKKEIYNEAEQTCSVLPVLRELTAGGGEKITYSPK
jgi:hypothetical protein